MSWWIPVLSFLGALIGAGVPAWSSWRSRRQEARVEWRPRLDKSIELMTAESEAARDIGAELLSDLVKSDLGSESDRALARKVAEIGVRKERSTKMPTAMDSVGPVGNTRGDEEDVP